MRTASRGSLRQPQQIDNFMGTSKAGVMDQRNNRHRSIQSAGMPPRHSQHKAHPWQLPTLGLNRFKNVEVQIGEKA